MDAELTMEKYCKKNNIDFDNWTDDEWEDMIDEFDDKLDDYLTDLYEEGKFDDYLKELLGREE